LFEEFIIYSCIELVVGGKGAAREGGGGSMKGVG
jgi:hypothetical protein